MTRFGAGRLKWIESVLSMRQHGDLKLSRVTWAAEIATGAGCCPRGRKRLGETPIQTADDDCHRRRTERRDTIISMNARRRKIAGVGSAEAWFSAHAFFREVYLKGRLNISPILDPQAPLQTNPPGGANWLTHSTIHALTPLCCVSLVLSNCSGRGNINSTMNP